jgi:hypothetical protein
MTYGNSSFVKLATSSTALDVSFRRTHKDVRAVPQSSLEVQAVMKLGLQYCWDVLHVFAPAALTVSHNRHLCGLLLMFFFHRLGCNTN